MKSRFKGKRIHGSEDEMRFTVRAQAFQSFRVRCLLVGLTIFVGVLVGLIASRTKDLETHRRAKSVQQLIRELQEQDTVVDQMRGRIWSFLPNRARKLTPSLMPERATLVRIRAANELRYLGPAGSEAVPSLLGALGDADRSLSLAALAALEAIGPKAKVALPHLLQLLDETAANRATPNADMLRPEVPSALAAIGPEDPAVLSSLQIALRGKDVLGASLRSSLSAARAMGKIAREDNAAVPLLVAALRDSDVRLQREIINTLGHVRVRTQEIVRALTELLESGDPQQRSSVLQALANFGPEATASRRIAR